MHQFAGMHSWYLITKTSRISTRMLLVNCVGKNGRIKLKLPESGRNSRDVIRKREIRGETLSHHHGVQVLCNNFKLLRSLNVPIFFFKLQRFGNLQLP